MKISVPTLLDEINLGQMVALVKFELLQDRLAKVKGSMSEKDAILFEQLLSDITGHSIRVIQMLGKDSMQKFIELVGKLMIDFRVQFGILFSTKEKQNSFVIKQKGWFKKDITYYIGDAKKEPTHFWITILDGVMGRISKLKDGHFHRSVVEIPYILSCIAWPKGVDRLIKNKRGDLVVNFPLIAQKKEELLSLNAIEALKCYNFFLFTTTNYGTIKDTKLFIRHLESLIMSQAQSAKKSVKNTDGVVT